MTAIGLREEGDLHWYTDPADPALVYRSITTYISACMNKPWFGTWQAKLAAEFAVDNQHRISRTARRKGRKAAVDLIKNEAQRQREMKADVGTHAHDIIEALVLEAPGLPPLPEHLVGVQVDGEPIDVDSIVDGFLAFVADFGAVAELSETTVCHPLIGYAGTLDLIMRLEKLHIRVVIDAKTGKHLDLGMPSQLAALRRALEVWLPFGRKVPMPNTDACAVLHLRREFTRGYKLRILTANEEAEAWEQFQRFITTVNWAERNKKSMGTVTYPPLPDGSQPLPLLEDIDGWGRTRGVLMRTAEFTQLDEVAGFRAEELLGVKGFGAKSLEDVHEMLAAYGLTLVGAESRAA